LANAEIKKSFEGSNIPLKDREIIALISYMQRLGTDIQVKDKK
jgi:cytochrome c oxidase cbb3-type subunit I/II